MAEAKVTAIISFAKHETSNILSPQAMSNEVSLFHLKMKHQQDSQLMHAKPVKPFIQWPQDGTLLASKAPHGQFHKHGVPYPHVYNICIYIYP